VKITCREASRLISAGLDTDLNLSQRTALRLHLLFCDACTRLKAQFEFMRRALGAYADRDNDER
jgi:hypothetical protein